MEKAYRSAVQDGDVDVDEETGKGGVALGKNAFADISDFHNDEFVYTY